MSSLGLKVAAIALLLTGESLSILTEILAARGHSFWKMLPIMALAGALLLGGYVVGYRGFQNIWIVSCVSITSILFMEPTLAYAIFRELPGRGAAIGLTCGLIGFAATLVDSGH